MTERTNEAWLSDLRAQAPEALEDLRARLQRGIFYYLSRERSDLSSLSSHEVMQMAQDMAQDSLMRVLANLDSFRGDSLFTTWATRVAVRVAISGLRRASFRDYSLDALTADGEPAWLNASPVMSGKPPNPEHAAEKDEVMGRLQDSIKEALTDRQYRALVAVAVDGVPMEIVAERLGTNRNALYKLVHDARRKLRAHLEAQGLNMDYMLRLFEER